MYDSLPEGLVGTIMGFEGVKGCMTAMNGPTGCKYYPASLSEAMNRHGGFNPITHQSRFLFGQSRLPCTYLDGNDYVNGAHSKVRELYDECRNSDPALLALINSPGASLIGEVLDMGDDEVPTAMIESPSPSVTFSEGYEAATIAALDALLPFSSEREPMTVNLLGISIADLGWEDSIADLRGLLSLCGIRVLATLGAGCTIEDMQASSRAALNIVIHDERCQATVGWYHGRYGTPHYHPSSGAPVGFGPLTEWLEGVCSHLGADPSPALEAVVRAKRRAVREISFLNSNHDLPRGTSFSIKGRPSLVLPVLTTLHGYLGMVPVAVSLTEEGPRSKDVEAYLRDAGCGKASTEVMECPADVVIADGNTAISVLARGKASNAVEIDPPSLTIVKIREDPIIGLGGTMRLLDRVLQGLRR